MRTGIEELIEMLKSEWPVILIELLMIGIVTAFPLGMILFFAWIYA